MHFGILLPFDEKVIFPEELPVIVAVITILVLKVAWAFEKVMPTLVANFEVVKVRRGLLVELVDELGSPTATSPNL